VRDDGGRPDGVRDAIIQDSTVSTGWIGVRDECGMDAIKQEV
jgi:hypothetical protein